MLARLAPLLLKSSRAVVRRRPAASVKPAAVAKKPVAGGRSSIAMRVVGSGRAGVAGRPGTSRAAAVAKSVVRISRSDMAKRVVAAGRSSIVRRVAGAKTPVGAGKPVGVQQPLRAKKVLDAARRAPERQRPSRESEDNALGFPPMRLVRAEGGGTQTLLSRTMQHAEMLNEADLTRLKRLVEEAESSARAMSQGRSAPGKRRASRGTTVNVRSGQLARSWSSGVQRQSSGVTLALNNSAGHAGFLAFGTEHIPAHGPFKAALAKHQGAIDGEWRRLGRVASARRAAHAQTVGGARHIAMQLARSGD